MSKLDVYQRQKPSPAFTIPFTERKVCLRFFMKFMAHEKDKIIGGMAWKFAERISSQGVSFILSVVLARMLMPEEYGLIAMINLFIVIANVFVCSGFTAALVQKKDADEIDYSTMFYCTLVTSLLMYGLVYLIAPYIASFYNMPELCILTRVYALSLILSSYQTIQQAYIARNMLFKKTFISTFIATLFSGVLGVIMAYNGYGVWSLVGQYIANVILNSLTLTFVIPWHPRRLFSITRAKSLMGYGSKILASSLLGTIYKEIRQLIIGKMFTPADLGYYNRGNHLPQLVRTNLDHTILSVLFPAMSNHSDKPEEIRNMLRKGIKISSYITFFFFTLMSTISEPLIKVLLTEKWLHCVPYMQIFCLSYMFLIIAGYNVEAIKALGKSKEVLKLEVFKKPLFIVVILVAAQYSVMAVALTSPFNSLYAMVMNMKPTRKYLGYNLREQISDIVPATLLAVLLFVTTWPLTLVHMNSYLIISIQIIVSILVYWLGSAMFKVEAYQVILKMIKEKFLQHK